MASTDRLLNYLLSSHVWRHNGFSHQDSGFIDHVVIKRRKSFASTYRLRIVS